MAKPTDPPGKPDDPGHQAHEVTIVVNAKEKIVPRERISFEEVVRLFYEPDPVPTGDNWVFDVAYHRGADEKPQGTLTEGETVMVKDRMVFDVTASDKS